MFEYGVNKRLKRPRPYATFGNLLTSFKGALLLAPRATAALWADRRGNAVTSRLPSVTQD